MTGKKRKFYLATVSSQRSIVEVFLQLLYIATVYSSGKDALALAVFKTAQNNASCDKILQCDCTALYSAAGHGLYTQFTRPSLVLRKWVGPARLA